MKIAISSTGSSLDAQMDLRFGRCTCFLLVDPETQALEILNNEAVSLGGGAGIQAAQMVVNSGAAAVITGNIGPNAGQTLAAAGVKVYLAAAGTVREVLQHYLGGRLQQITGSSVEAHFRTGSFGAGRGLGRGRSMGRGMGCGRGMGGGTGLGLGTRRGYLSDWQATGDREGLEALKRQREQLREQMSRIEERIRELEEKE